MAQSIVFMGWVNPSFNVQLFALLGNVTDLPFTGIPISI